MEVIMTLSFVEVANDRQTKFTKLHRRVEHITLPGFSTNKYPQVHLSTLTSK